MLLVPFAQVFQRSFLCSKQACLVSFIGKATWLESRCFTASFTSFQVVSLLSRFLEGNVKMLIFLWMSRSWSSSVSLWASLWNCSTSSLELVSMPDLGDPSEVLVKSQGSLIKGAFLTPLCLYDCFFQFKDLD